MRTRFDLLIIRDRVRGGLFCRKINALTADDVVWRRRKLRLRVKADQIACLDLWMKIRKVPLTSAAAE